MLIKLDLGYDWPSIDGGKEALEALVKPNLTKFYII